MDAYSRLNEFNKRCIDDTSTSVKKSIVKIGYEWLIVQLNKI